jgi:hypothetical protein
VRLTRIDLRSGETGLHRILPVAGRGRTPTEVRHVINAIPLGVSRSAAARWLVEFTRSHLSIFWSCPSIFGCALWLAYAGKNRMLSAQSLTQGCIVNQTLFNLVAAAATAELLHTAMETFSARGKVKRLDVRARPSSSYSVLPTWWFQYSTSTETPVFITSSRLCSLPILDRFSDSTGFIPR